MAYFDENKKFLGLNGVLGRRDFFINCLIIEIIENLIFVTPYFISVIFNADIRAIVMGEAVRPLWFPILQCVIGLASSALYFPSVVRRVRDIIGEDDDNRIFLIASTITVIIFMGYTPVVSSFWGVFLLAFTLCSLFFKQGKITGQKPKSEIIKFNWGAFFGTWIWGLTNKVPKTLAILPLFLTMAWFPFALICGLKGNEWLYEKKTKDKDIDLSVFHTKQQNQSVVFLVLAPVIMIITLFLTTVFGVFLLRSYSKGHPEFVESIQSRIQQTQLDSVESGFEKVELKDGVYRFYMDPEDWALAAAHPILKQSIINSAINYVLLKEGKSTAYLKDRLELIEKLNEIKIYSSFNEEILGEFYVDPKLAKEALKDIDNIDKKQEIRKAFKNAYKFNLTPAIP